MKYRYFVRVYIHVVMNQYYGNPANRGIWLYAKEQPSMIGFNKALDIILREIEPLDIVEVSLSEAFGMVLAEDVCSDMDIPPFDKSAMDGYAVRSADLDDAPATLSVLATVAAGSMHRGTAGKGQSVRIMTGAPVPEGFDAVVMLEETEEREGKVLFTRKAKQGQNICSRGEDVKAGERILVRGSIILGPEIAALASVGQVRCRVYRRPVVSVLPTGSEILEPDEPVGEGMIRDSNGPMLTGLAASQGANLRYLGIGSDQEEELRELIEAGLKTDMLLISGGVSMGDYDLVPAILRACGADIKFHRVRIKPGKPLLFAKSAGCVIFGVPGNPVSNFTTFNIFIKSALYRMMGRSAYTPRFVDARLTHDVKKKGDRAHLMPSKYRLEKGNYEVTTLKLNGSADIIGCGGCNCLLFVDEGEKNLRRGDKVPILLIDG
jgi:molybdopterin molybdotransferase